MKKHLLLIFCLCSYILGYAQHFDTHEPIEKIGFIRENGQHYDECSATTFAYGDSIDLVISPRDTEDTPFQFYISLGGKKGVLPEGFYTYNVQESPSAHTLSASFVRKYADWGNAYRDYPLRRVHLYVQRFDESYLVSGKAQLDTEGAGEVEFMYYGLIAEESIEIQRLLVFNFENYLNNKGEMLWQAQSISTPCAFQESKDDKRRVIVVDRILFQDRKLDYGISFEFETNDRLASGKFKSDDMDRPVKVTFFNQGEMMYPENSQLTIQYNSKKREYTLNYQLNFPDNQILKGTYKGKIPQDDF